MKAQSEKMGLPLDPKIFFSVLAALLVFAVGTYVYSNLIVPSAEKVKIEGTKAANSARKKAADVKKSVVAPFTASSIDKSALEWTEAKMEEAKRVSNMDRPGHKYDDARIYRNNDIPEKVSEDWIPRLRTAYFEADQEKRVVTYRIFSPFDNHYSIIQFLLIKNGDNWRNLVEEPAS